MAKRSPHFFTYGNHPIAKLPDYLESMLWKMCKDPQFTSSGSEELARITGEAVEAQNRLGETSVNGKDKENGSGGGGEGDATQNSNVCTHEQLEKLAEKLDDKWVKLFPKLGLDKEVKEEIENDHKEARGKENAVEISFQF